MKPADPGRRDDASTGGVKLDAANDDHGPADHVAREHAAKEAGWDPFEVWRTRVRDARRGEGDEADA